MRLSFDRGFLKQYKKLRQSIKEHADERLRLFAVSEFDPALDSHKLKGEWSGYRSINITGDYRAIFETHPGLAHFVAIGTHDELYGR